MGKSKIKILIVGCGAVTQLFYRPALSKLSKSEVVEVVGMVDPYLGAAQSMLTDFPSAICSVDLESILERIRPELAIVASPPIFHSTQAEFLLNQGVHVLCEKPMASAVEQCLRMIQAAERNRCTLAVGHYKRFYPTHLTIKSLIENQTFGPLRKITIHEGGKFDWPVKSDTFFKNEFTPGGVLFDVGVHALDLLLWWVGKPQSFTYHDDAKDGQEANCKLFANWKDELCADIHFSRDWITSNVYRFEFVAAIVELKVNRSNKLTLSFNGLPFQMESQLQNFNDGCLAYDPKDAFTAQLIDVCHAVLKQSQSSVTGTDGLAVIEWIENCYANREPIKEPWRTEEKG